MLARAGLSRLSPRATATLLLASNVPDLDSVARFCGPLNYLEHHRGITHSLVGILAQSFLIAALLSWRPRSSLQGSLPSLSSRRALALIRNRTRPPPVHGLNERFVFLTFGTDIKTAPEFLPIWFAGYLVAFLIIRRWVPLDGRLASRVALAVLAAYGCSLAVSHYLSLSETRDQVARQEKFFQTTAPVQEIAAIPLPAAPFRWLRILETGAELLFHDEVSNRRSPLARNLTRPPVELVRKSGTGETLFRFFRFPAAEIQLTREVAALILRDERFSRTPASGFGVHHSARSLPHPLRR